MSKWIPSAVFPECKIWLIIALLIVLQACSSTAKDVEATGTLDTEAPTIDVVSPDYDQSDVSVVSQVRITFSESMRDSSFTDQSFFIHQNSTAVESVFSYDTATHSAVLTPVEPLQYASDYTVSVTASVTDLAGNAVTALDYQFTTGVQRPWGKIYRGSPLAESPINDAELLSDGGYVVVGDSSSANDNAQAFVMRLDIEGGIKWQKLVNSEITRFTLSSVGVLSDGTFVAAGDAASKGVLLHLDKDGTVLQQKIFDPGTDSYLQVHDVIGVADGGVVLAGRMGVGTAEYNGYVFKFDKDMVPGTAVTIGQIEHQEISAIEQLGDGSYVAVGLLYDPNLARVNAFILGLTENFSIDWQKIVDSGGNDYFNDVAVTNTGYYIAGNSSNATNDGWMVHMSGSGTPFYSRVFDLDGNDEGFGTVTIINSGTGTTTERYIFGGTTLVRYSGNTDALFVAVDYLTDIMWQQTVAGRASEGVSVLMPSAIAGVTAMGGSKSFSALVDDPTIYRGDGWAMRFNYDGSHAFSENSGVQLQYTSGTISDLAVTYSDGSLAVNAVTTMDMTDASLGVLETQRRIENLTGPVTDIAAPTAAGANTDGPNRIVVSWTDNADNELGYVIFRSENGVDFSRHATVAQDVASYTDVELTTGTVYYYKVVGFNAEGYSDFSNVPSETSL